MSKVVISYRRSDSTDVAGRIYDHLCQHFRRANLFKDVDSIPPGADFRKVISDTIKSCDVVLVIIGREWLTAANSRGVRRLDEPDDPVRIELEEALARDVPLIPVLVGGAEMPSHESLPTTLRPLAFRHAIRVRPDPDFGSDVRRLVHALRKTTKGGKFHTLLFRPGRPRIALITAALITVLLSVVAGLQIFSSKTGSTTGGDIQNDVAEPRSSPPGSDNSSNAAKPLPSPPAANNSPAAGRVPDANSPYGAMSKEERRKFIEQQAQRISGMLGDTPSTFNVEGLNLIQYWVDSYASRVGNGRTGRWGGDLRLVLQRGERTAPVIIKAFKDKKVPPVIGLYLAMIVSEYENIKPTHDGGATGMFQVIPGAARQFGFSSTDLTDNEKAAQMAASYMAGQIADWGRDTANVTFAIASFNQSPQSLRREIKIVLDTTQKERSFWTLVAERGELDTQFKRETYGFVPRFFAAAIVGENPQAFGIQMEPLSKHAEMPTGQE